MPAQKSFAASVLSATFFAGALAITTVPALAAERSVEVAYGDLDLTTDAGASTLQQRVKRAVTKVCGTADVRNISEVQDVKRCRSEASARSSRDIALALESARSGERLASLTIEK